MSSRHSDKLSRIEAKLDELQAMVYEMRGELKGWRQYVIFLSSITALVITLLFNMILG